MDIIKEGNQYHIYCPPSKFNLEIIKNIGVTYILDVFQQKQRIENKPRPWFNSQKTCWIVDNVHYRDMEQLIHRFTPENNTAKTKERIFSVKPLPELNIEIPL